MLLVSCTGTGSSVATDGELYGGTGPDAGSGTGGSSSSQSRNFDAGTLLNYSNAGDVQAIISLVSSGGTEAPHTSEAVFSAADLGLPSGGSVTLTITGSGLNYEATATAEADGTVRFTIPFIAVGTEITVQLDVMGADGTVVYTGLMKQTVTADCTIAVSLESTGPDIPDVPEGFVLVENGSSNFYICIHEVTQGEYETYCSYGGSSPSAAEGLGSDYPAYYISWYDTLVYCNKRSIAEGVTPVYSIGGSTNPADWGSVPSSDNATWNAVSVNASADGYRLPTEAEWVLAADDGHTYSGSNSPDEVAWYNGNAGSRSHEVKTKSPNERGIYDMSGNVFEWCFDKYSSSMTSRVRRGGSWDYNLSECSVSFQGNIRPEDRYASIGFRVVRNAP